jgi:hypothetical protein
MPGAEADVAFPGDCLGIAEGLPSDWRELLGRAVVEVLPA